MTIFGVTELCSPWSEWQNFQHAKIVSKINPSPIYTLITY